MRKGLSLKQAPGMAQTGKSVPLLPGWYSGEAPWTSMDKILHCCPCNADQIRFCPRAQTPLGCLRDSNPEVPCSLDHTILPAEFWPPEFLDQMLGWGGHKDWGGELSTPGLMSLMSADMAESVLLLGPGKARDEALLYHATTRLANLSLPAGEHLELEKIQCGSGYHL